MTLDALEAQRINKKFAANCGYNNVKDWLFGLGLGQYLETFIDNGYDCFRICAAIKEIDIQTIGIEDPYHIDLLVRGVERLNNPKAKSVYYRLSVTSIDDNDIRQNGELTHSNSTKSEDTLTNGFNSHKITEDYYLKKPTLAEKRMVRSKVVQMQVDLAEAKYNENSLHMDALAEHISTHIQIDELHVYDILCQLRAITRDKLSPVISKRQVVSDSMPNGDAAVTTPLSSEDVFSPAGSIPASEAVSAPKPISRPKKPPRSFNQTEDKVFQVSPLHFKKTSPELTSNGSSVSPEPTADSAYDLLHPDSPDPKIMSTGNSPTKVKKLTKSEEILSPRHAPVHSASSSLLSEESQYFILDGSHISENPIGNPSRSRSVTAAMSAGIFKRNKTLPKKHHTVDDISQNTKKPPSQPPPPPPVATTSESDNPSKQKPDKVIKQSNTTSHFYTDDVVIDNVITEPYTASKTKKEGRKTGLFRKTLKPKSDVKKNRKSKDESDLKLMMDSNEMENSRPLAKVISKSTDNLCAASITEEINTNEENQVTLTSPKKVGLPVLPVQINEDFLKKYPLSQQSSKSDLISEKDTSSTFNTPHPIARKRNSPEENTAAASFGYKPHSLKEEKTIFHSQTLPRVSTTPPPKPKRLISEEVLYDNVEHPNPAPRIKKADSPLSSLPEYLNSAAPRTQPPDVVPVVSEKPPHPVTSDPQPSANVVRVKPEKPKGKKPVLKKKPSKDNNVHLREKSIGDNRENKSQISDTLSPQTGSSIKRITSPLTAPPLPTTKRPDNPPEPPPLHLIPSLRPVAHVRPTKPPIITPPSANTSSPVAEPRNPENWKRIEDKIYTILKEEDFIDYLTTHYTGENGECKITAGLVSRLANETSFPIHHIASAVDNIRLTRLIEMGRPAVPISLQDFDAMDPNIETGTMERWLTSIGLPLYIDVFCENVSSFDEIKDLDPDDLIDYGVVSKHRGYLYSAIEMLQSSNSK